MRNKRHCLLLMLSMLIALICSLTAFAAPSGAKAGIDTVLVLDSSGSLDSRNNPTDPDLISFEAAKVFIDQVEMQGSRIGLVVFGTDIEKEYPVTEISSEADKQAIKDAIDEAKNIRANHREKLDTDIGEAAEHAVNLLKDAGDVGNQKAVVFFTDGVIDFGQVQVDDATKAQMVTDSTQQAKNAAADASDNGVRIYTIGLNYNNSLKDDSLISEMASTSNGKMHKISSAEEVPGIFFNIFAELIQSKNLESAIEDITITNEEEYGEAVFNIPNSSVTEANITMRPQGGELRDVLLVDPNGNQLDASDPNVYLNLYSTLGDVKVVNPTPGDWTLRVKGTEGVTITSMLVMNSDVSVVLDVVDAADDNTATVKAYLEDQSGNVLNDASLYQSYVNSTANSPRAEVTMNGTQTQYPLTFDGSIFTGDIPVAMGETATVTVYIESDINSRYSNEVTYTNARVKAPVTIETSPIPSPIVLKGLVPSMAKEELDLGQYFTISEGSMVFEAPTSSDDTIAQTDLNGYTLNLKGKKRGDTTVTVKATDMDGTVSAEQTFDITVDTTFPSLIPVIAGGAGILALLLALIIIMIKLATRPKLKGILAWVVKENTTFGSKNPTPEDLTMLRKIETDFGAIVTDPEAAFFDLNKIRVRALRNGIRIINNSASCMLVDEYGGNPKSMDIREGQSFSIVCRGDGPEVVVACEYLGDDDGGLGGDGGFDGGFGGDGGFDGGFGGDGGFDDGFGASGFGGGADDGFGGGFDDGFGGGRSSGGRKSSGKSSGRGGKKAGGRGKAKAPAGDGYETAPFEGSNGSGGFDDSGFGDGFDDGFDGF